ncbi:hypothetical protein [Mucilaginibacter lacusdianchii]|uniref:hypothetical protein n=1 Tax=Mucilaginibacter lacusdianchii TaxID=2684211 RepID=UPI00131E944A|nr:hypothetical protein [Mucilaginibacter sp. JXJ CY 39]
MKRISFLAVLLVSLFSLNSAKAQVGLHVGLNVGSPAYYEPAPPPVYYAPERVVVVHHRPAYYGRPVIVRRGYYEPRHVVVVDRGYYRGHGRGHAYGHRMYRRW